MSDEIALTERQQFWFDHIQAARTANMPLAQYAREHDLKPKDLYQWGAILVRRGALAPTKRNAHLLPVQLSSSAACTVQFPDGSRLELTQLPEGESLRDLINCLRQQ